MGWYLDIIYFSLSQVFFNFFATVHSVPDWPIFLSLVASGSLFTMWWTSRSQILNLYTAFLLFLSWVCSPWNQTSRGHLLSVVALSPEGLSPLMLIQTQAVFSMHKEDCIEICWIMAHYQNVSGGQDSKWKVSRRNYLISYQNWNC